MNKKSLEINYKFTKTSFMKSHNFQTLIFLFSILFLISCKQSKQADTSNYLVDANKITNIEGKKLSSLLEHFDIIPLETSDDCLIGEIFNIKKRCGRYYVQHSNQMKLDVFDENGKHLQTIGKVGNGPGEYFAICSYDADDQNIFLLSPGKMMVYDINGNFQKEIPIKEIVWRAIKRIENGFLVSCNQPLPDGNTIAYLDNECKIIKTALPYNYYTTKSAHIIWTEWEDGFYVRQLSDSKDFCCFDHKNLEFKTMGLSNSNDGVSISDIEEQMSINKGEFVSGNLIRSVTASSSQIYWFTSNNGYYDNILDKNSGKTYRISNDLEMDDLCFPENHNDALMGYLFKCSSDDDYLLSFIPNTNRLKEVVEGKRLKFELAYKCLEDVAEDANPSIAIMKFK